MGRLLCCSALAASLAALGTEINDFRNDQREDVSVIGYFDDPPDGDAIVAALADAVEIYGFPTQSIKSTATREVTNTDWLAEWKKHWKPTTVGKFVIAPPWLEVPETDKIVIRIEPNMAFGTGTYWLPLSPESRYPSRHRETSAPHGNYR